MALEDAREDRELEESGTFVDCRSPGIVRNPPKILIQEATRTNVSARVLPIDPDLRHKFRAPATSERRSNYE
jgi:hypothetical protein